MTRCAGERGQEPDTPTLQQTLHIQLLNKPMPDASESRIALGALKEAAKEKAVLLVLDDVWTASQVTQLNFVDSTARSSAVIITTRLRNLIDGADEVQCSVLSAADALELLLRSGGCDHLLDEPPPAALEAVELCGRLPLALGIAGGIIRHELADAWQAELVALLKDEFEEVSVEERVVNASLKIVPADMREGVEGFFAILGAFAEDATVPAAAIDAIAPLVLRAPQPEMVAQASELGAPPGAQVPTSSTKVTCRGRSRPCAGHDLVRECMIRRAEARDGGMHALQRDVVPRCWPPLRRAAGQRVRPNSLQWHVRGAAA